MATTIETPAAALSRIRAGGALGGSRNDHAVIMEFAARGVDLADIHPRENVLTFHAWKALGRRVARGAKSVRVLTWIPVSEREPKSEERRKRSEGKAKGGMRPKSACVFHVSQTIPDGQPDAKPAAWENPALIDPERREKPAKSERAAA